MASSQVASPQVEELSNNAEEQRVMTPPAQNFDIDKPVHLIDDDEEDEDDREIIPRRDEGKQVEDLDDATDEEEEDVGVLKPPAQFDNDDDDEEYEEPAGKGIRTRRFPDEDEDDE